MTFEYRNGYWKAILDVLENIVNHSNHMGLNSKKKYQKYIATYLTLLLQNPHVLDSFIQYGGAIWNDDTLSLSLKMKQDGTVFLDE